MPEINANTVNHYYQIKGEGFPLVFVHGGFVDSGMWEPQFEYFSQSFTVLRYDLRGHGKTGGTPKRDYSIELFADDLEGLLDSLNLKRVILCGLSLGGMVAQAFAIKNIDRLEALIMADTAVSVRLTLSDKIQRYILAPKWAMLAMIRWMSVPRFVDFSFKLARWTRNAEWFGEDPITASYVHQAMLNIPTEEYLKIYDAIYEFDLLDLSRITVPTLILNGEKESKAVFRHTKEMVKWIPQAETVIIPGAGHTSNMENPSVFNDNMDRFLSSLPLQRGQVGDANTR